MTNDMKAPEQIYILEEDIKELGPTWFIHCDLHLALVAAAYEDAAETCDVVTMDAIGDVIRAKGVEIAALTPDDAQAALGRMLQEEREKALREAAEECERVRIQKANGPMPEGACFDYEQRILALIEKDTP